MEFKEVITGRRSIRKFIDKKLNHEQIVELLKLGMQAPSAKNRQPWEFVVVQNDDKKTKIANTLEEKVGTNGIVTANVIKECSALVLVFANIENEIMDIQSVGACVENIVLAAYNEGIASLWIGYIKQIEEYLQQLYSKDKTLICAVALGYTENYPNARPRKDLDECTIWD